jgi:drug/metabolite transporter (DMT)-like permease
MVSQAVSHTQWQLFWVAATGCALGGSWLANALWYAAARRLPPTLSGQLIVFETLFALLYGFAWLQRWPRPLELASMLLLLGGGLGGTAACRSGGRTVSRSGPARRLKPANPDWS